MRIAQEQDAAAEARRKKARERKLRYVERTAAAGDQVITKGSAFRVSQSTRLKALADAAGLGQAQLVIQRLGLDGQPPVCACHAARQIASVEAQPATADDMGHLPVQFEKALVGRLTSAAARRLDRAFAERTNRLSPVAFLSTIIEAGLDATHDGRNGQEEPGRMHAASPAALQSDSRSPQKQVGFA